MNRDKAVQGAATTILLLTAAHVAGDFYGTFMGPLSPYLKNKLGLTIGNVTLLGAVMMAVCNYLQPVFGLASERLGRKRLLAGGILLSTVISAAGLGGNVFMVGALLVIGAMGVAAFHPAGAALSGGLGEEHRAKNLAIYMVGGNIGVMLPPLLVPWAGGRGMEWVAMLGIPGAMLALFLMKRLPADEVSTTRSVTRHDVKEMFRRLWPIHLDVVMRFFALNAYMLLLPLLGTLRGESETRAGYALALFMLVGAAGVAAGGRIVARFNERRFLVFSEIVGGICLVIAPMVRGIGFYVLLGVGAFFLYALMPIQIAVAQRLAPKTAGAASGVVMGLAYGNAGLLLFPLGRLGDYWTQRTGSELTSLTWMLQVSSAFIIVAGAVAALQSRNGRSGG